MNPALVQALMGSPAQSMPEDWWRQVPSQQRDWWTRRLNAMPHAGGGFNDELFKAPVAPGTQDLNFDRNAIHPDWLRR